MKGTGSIINKGLVQNTLFVLAVILMGAMVENTYLLQIMTFIGINTLLALGLNMLMGYAGQVSLGQGAFYGIGAYATAILSGTHGVSPWLALVFAIALAVGVAWVVGRPTLRLSGYYLGMGTLGFGMIVHIFFREAGSLTGGASGFVGIPMLGIGSFMFEGGRSYFYLVWAVVFGTMLVCRRIIDSKTGRALAAIHGRENAAVALGVDAHSVKLTIFMFSAALGAMAGFFYAHFVLFISPDSFGFMASIKMVTMVVIGGMASVWGAVLGAAVITLLPEVLHGFADYEMIVFGVILMGVMIVMPQGLTQGVVDQYDRYRKKRA
ncbi:ABC-type branched-chain amino acid transport-system, ATP-binding protein [Desulforapulum autotrophicum HRM2]|uniref:ABC-type branched-chain amino acid transport-system, ATP-binding protein n=1 Tax=Desulforapulum autotrophicum (strain ATCC 43914 / DSM 3382 / VKM B-1955 / HRM2) TaxID=177437 RepID=C0QH71_DESAH|nr:branched-chain amino acid ABC transporter permease [Desulforapulum autotrophicum]ACN17730.1 ABC-type branched-chain amino acid transport-system, ATP-binding protein [Desulforapulum autotrophicum HRM2]